MEGLNIDSQSSFGDTNTLSILGYGIGYIALDYLIFKGIFIINKIWKYNDCNT
jgi:hypothetical protein